MPAIRCVDSLHANLLRARFSSAPPTPRCQRLRCDYLHYVVGVASTALASVARAAIACLNCTAPFFRIFFFWFVYASFLSAFSSAGFSSCAHCSLLPDAPRHVRTCGQCGMAFSSYGLLPVWAFCSLGPAHFLHGSLLLIWTGIRPAATSSFCTSCAACPVAVHSPSLRTVAFCVPVDSPSTGLLTLGLCRKRFWRCNVRRASACSACLHTHVWSVFSSFLLAGFALRSRMGLCDAGFRCTVRVAPARLGGGLVPATRGALATSRYAASGMPAPFLPIPATHPGFFSLRFALSRLALAGRASGRQATGGSVAFFCSSY